VDIKHVFISHTTADDAVVAEIRIALGRAGVEVWADSQRLSGGDLLEPRIREAIETAQHFIAVLSTPAINSTWVAREVKYALEVQKKRTDGFKVIPVLLPPIEPSALGLWFGEEPVAVRIQVGPGGIAAAMPDLLAALGLQLPTERESPSTVGAAPIADLLLALTQPTMRQWRGKRRAAATGRLTYIPPEPTARKIESKLYPFTAPLGPIEAGELAWYLERYWHWPSGVFQQRARRVEEQLPQWGEQLHGALMTEAAREPFEAWRRGGEHVERRLTIRVDRDPGFNDKKKLTQKQRERKERADEAATLLLALPWELLRDDQGYIFEGPRGVRVRRALPNRIEQRSFATEPPIRVLLVSPRPEDEHARYFDHRASARPLVDALTPLGELVKLTMLAPPTFKALKDELLQAFKAGTPYHVVHFDGHGVYDWRYGLGALCFETPQDATRLEKRRTKIVHATELAEALRDCRVPLFVLDACQSAKAEEDPTASVAARLLQGGVASVVAMSHSVLVETARRFVTAFYRELMGGARIGQAMLAGQRELKDATFRGKVFTGELHLHDWFVPVLFQEEVDPQLIREVPAAQVRAVIEQQRKLSLGELPPEPEHTFVGRSRELLKAERLLDSQRYVVFRGEGGEGKTTLAAELARWLVFTGRFRRAGFVRLDQHGDARKVLYALGDQLIPGFLSQVGDDFDLAAQHVERALAEQKTILVLDNVESVLPPAPGSMAASLFEPELLDGILKLCQRLSEVDGARVVFTSRQKLPEPFHRNHVAIDRLDRPDAIALVGEVLGEGSLMPHAADPGESEEEIEKLVDAVGCHARSLVLLAREVAERGIRHATQHLGELMAALHERYPDDRERSLFASVELSLRRLPADLREKLAPLAVFHDGSQIQGIAYVLGLDPQKPEQIAPIAKGLIDVGLAELRPYNYLRLHPALGPALLGELSEEEREAARGRWAAAMTQLAGFLYEQRFKDTQLAATLTLLELPNLLAALEFLYEGAQAGLGEGEAPAEPTSGQPAARREPRPPTSFERVVDVATRIESLLQNLGRPKALARVAKIREDATRHLGAWSHARFNAESAAVRRLLDAGQYPQAVAAARGLLDRAEAAGEGAYEEAAYDLAMAHFTLGRALGMSGDAEAALAPLAEARERFQKLAGADSEAAARMASVSLTETGDCLLLLGRLDAAADAYQMAIDLDEKRGDLRDVATGRGQLGTVRMLQRRHAEALAAWTEAREAFERLGEPGSVATAWHQIGRVHEEAGQYESAEHAYQEALKIEVQMGDRSGEASTLGQLGNLYAGMGRSEDAVRFYRQATRIDVELGDLANEGRDRNNAAVQLIKLGRYDEARQEVLRAIECKESFGHAAEPWTTFAVLCDLERAEGNEEAAAEARQCAIEAYLAYRHAGGENRSTAAGVAARLGQAMAENRIAHAEAEVNRWLAHPDLPKHPSFKALLTALQAVLAGSRDPGLAADPGLEYRDAVELLLLLEKLGSGESQ